MGKRRRGNRRAAGAATPPAARALRSRRSRRALLAVAGLALSGLALHALVSGGPGEGRTLEVVAPELGAVARRGAVSFAKRCASCHGENAGGTGSGPPLVHRIYEPSHHGDAAFRRAVRFGVRPHHWNFGAMPMIAVSDREIDGIIAYVREVQRANGIR